MYKRVLMTAAVLLAGAAGGPVDPGPVGQERGSGYIVQYGGPGPLPA